MQKPGDDGTLTCLCGNTLAPGESFCTVCGNIVEADDPPTPTPSPALSPPDDGMPPLEILGLEPGGFPPPPPMLTAPPRGKQELLAPPLPVHDYSTAVPAPAPNTPLPPIQSMGAPMPSMGAPMPGMGASMLLNPAPAQVPATPGMAGMGFPSTASGPSGYAQCTCGAMITLGQAMCAVCGTPTQPQPGFGAAPPPYATAAQGTTYAPNPMGPEAVPRVPGRRERILVIDDDQELLTYLQRILALEFYEVLVATDGSDGLILALTAAPDMIILDLALPGIDGLTLCKKLRAHSQTRAVPIIIVTAKKALEDEIAGLKAGADDYLTKPVNSMRLVARVEAQVQRLRQRR